MATLEHTVSQNLKCPVCFDLLTYPKQLSCTHTFCKTCIRDILAFSLLKNILSCPICRNTTTVANCDVANLKTNIPVKSLVDGFRNSKQLCDTCDKQSRAAHFCCDCGKNMCNACLQDHNNWNPNLKHKVVSVEDIREGRVVLEKKLYCREKIHRTEKYECTDVCTTCKKLICTRCRMLYHTPEKGHRVKDAGEYTASIKDRVENLQSRGETKTKTVKNHMTCIDHQIKRVNYHIDGEKAKNNRICEEAINKITESNATLNKQLDDQKEKLVRSLNNMKIDNQRLVKSIESASDLLSNSLKGQIEGDAAAICDSLSFELNNVLDRDNPKKMVAIDVGDHAEELTFTPSCDPDTLSMGELRFVKCKPKCNAALSKKDAMNGIAASNNGMVAVGYSEGGIYIFSPNCQLQEAVIKDVWIVDLGFLSDGCYAVRDRYNKMSLYTSNEERQDVTFDTLGKSEGGTGGLAVDSNDLIYVSYRKAKKIQVFSPSGGKAIRVIPCDGYEPKQITSYGDSLIVKQDDTQIARINKKGVIMYQLLRKPLEIRLFAAVSKDNTILISSVRFEEGLLNIDEYTGELKHIRSLISDYKIEKPERHWYYLQQFQSGEIAFCTPDRLYVFNLVTSKVTS
ncbi:E3 ubiquitin-protein ligase TRIM33-like [Lytechinus pictus]|uniref:E3 ubiquitin-protein ligase TRIM33-like n=1 Tax=Lytechinus pictus TaxID=7653 RepID=UPI0030BA0EB8